jgi:hypothetical protein
MSASLAPIRRAALNPQHLAHKAILKPSLLPDITKGLQADKPRVKYGCAKALRLISEQRPDVLYPHFGFFAGLLDHQNKIFQWDAAFVLSQLVRADAQDEFAAIFEKYFAPISGPVMISAANAIQGGARVARAKPRLADRIAAEILKVSCARYQTPECRNVAIGHAIVALGDMLPLLSNAAPVVRFVRKQTRNRRPATRKKAERFLRSQDTASAR